MITINESLQITKDIILKLIENKNFSKPANEQYVEEVCKSFKTVYKAVIEAQKTIV